MARDRVVSHKVVQALIPVVGYFSTYLETGTYPETSFRSDFDLSQLFSRLS
jgi:hypothetical protein